MLEQTGQSNVLTEEQKVVFKMKHLLTLSTFYGLKKYLKMPSTCKPQQKANFNRCNGDSLMP